MTDLFCGAGGSALGAVAVAGVQLVVAVDHWQLAVETHQANFPDVDHDCADISQVDPRRYRRTDILWASPECTWQSGARGCRRDDHPQPALFGDPVPAEAGVRSRATMFDVHRFAEYHRYGAIVVENVVEAFTRWELRRSWLAGLEDLGYAWRVVSLNSMHAPAAGTPGAPQSRDRAYCVAWRRGSRAPDLDVRPGAWCAGCGARVEAVQWWKRPAPRPVGKYRVQYLYRCPACREVVEPDVLPAAAAIDWTLAGQRIRDRIKPLSAKTLARIQAGLERYARPMTFEARGNTFVRTGPDGRPANARAWPVDQPTATLTATETRALVVPVEGREGKQAQPAEEAMRTQTARAETALVVPYYGTGVAHPAGHPLHTVSTRDRFGVAFLAGLVRSTSSMGADWEVRTCQSARTNTTGHQPVVSHDIPAIGDCLFRMLSVPEISAVMAFPPGYRVKGSKRQQVRQLGNAVTPPAAEWLFRAVVTALGGAP